MIDFIVSGQIPGLHLQITFLFWMLLLTAAIVFVGARLLRRALRSQFARAEETTEAA